MCRQTECSAASYEKNARLVDAGRQAEHFQRGQLNLAFQIALDSGDDNLQRRQCQVWDRVDADLLSLLASKEIARAELLTAMFRKYPAAAKRMLNAKEG